MLGSFPADLGAFSRWRGVKWPDMQRATREMSTEGLKRYRAELYGMIRDLTREYTDVAAILASREAKSILLESLESRGFEMMAEAAERRKRAAGR